MQRRFGFCVIRGLIAISIFAAIATTNWAQQVDGNSPAQGLPVIPPPADPSMSPPRLALPDEPPQVLAIDRSTVYDLSVEAGPHHRRKTVQNAEGREAAYVELASGLNRFDETTGSWRESFIKLEPIGNGKALVSKNASWDAIYSADSADENGGWDILLPPEIGADGKPNMQARSRFRGRCVGLAVTLANGKAFLSRIRAASPVSSPIPM